MPLLAMVMIYDSPPGRTDLHSALPHACSCDICGFFKTSSNQIAADILMRCGNCGMSCSLGHSLVLVALRCGVLELEVCHVPRVHFLQLGL